MKHTRKCPCSKCVGRRFKSYVAKAHLAGLPSPTNPEKLVVVRAYRVPAHYRSTPNYLSSDPALFNAIRDFVDAMNELANIKKKGTLSKVLKKAGAA